MNSSGGKRTDGLEKQPERSEWGIGPPTTTARCTEARMEVD